MEILANVTEQLRNGTKKDFRKKYAPSDLNGAVWAAATYAKENNCSMFVYTGNSYINLVRRVTFKREDATNPINNTGGHYFEITADLQAIKHVN